MLCKWIKEDMSLVQDAKDREERVNGRAQIKLGTTGNSTGNYFIQHNPEVPSRHRETQQGTQASGGIRRTHMSNGMSLQGQKVQGAGQIRVNKYPDCQIALERWRSLKKVGEEIKPMTKDCPLKCSHAIPFGNAGWCMTFRNRVSQEK